MGMFAEPASAADHAPAGKAAGMIHLDQRLAEHAPGSRLQHLALELGEAQRHRAGQFDRPAERRIGQAQEIGRASCRERVCQYVSISVVAVSLKKKKINTKTITKNRGVP